MPDYEREEEEVEEEEDSAPYQRETHPDNADYMTNADNSYGLPIYGQPDAPDYENRGDPEPTHDHLNNVADDNDLPPVQGYNDDYQQQQQQQPHYNDDAYGMASHEQAIGDYPDEQLGGVDDELQPPMIGDTQQQLSSNHNDEGHHGGLPTPPPDSPSLLLPEGQQQQHDLHNQAPGWVASPSKISAHSEQENDAGYPPMMMPQPPNDYQQQMQQSNEVDEFL